MEHKIRWEAVDISLHGLVQDLGLHPIKLGQIGVEDHLLVPEDVDERGDFLGDQQATGGCGNGFFRGGFLFGGHGWESGIQCQVISER